MKIADFIPVLDGGSHPNPESGACVMEMVSVLSGDVWTDMPKCTNTYIALVAQTVNDFLEDKDRHRVLDEFHRLFNTTEGGREFDESLISMVGILANKHQGDMFEKGYVDLLIKKALDGRTSSFKMLCAISVPCDIAHPTEYLMGLLTTTLDLYDTMTGRGTVAEQDVTKLKEVLHV